MIRVHADAGQIGHQQIGQVDQHFFAIVFLGLDVRGRDHAVAVGHFDRVGLRRAIVGFDFDVPANHQDAVGFSLKAKDPLIAKIQRVAAQVHRAGAAGDRDWQDKLFVVLIPLNHHQQLLIFLVVIQRKESFEQLCSLGYFAPVWEFWFRLRGLRRGFGSRGRRRLGRS